jgi:hypothetical protein
MLVREGTLWKVRSEIRGGAEARCSFLEAKGESIL